MTPRIAKLRQESFEAQPDISVERAVLVTQFYKKNYGKFSIPVLRALNFKNLCQKKTIYIGDDELIVGERGPYPKAVSTFPELNCHSVEDLEILNSRKMTRYTVSDEDIERYKEEVIPILEVLDEIHLLQPQANVQISHKTPDRFLKAACRVIRKGYGYPSVFNTDEIIMEQLRTGKTLEDARQGGCSDCIETGCFGKEAYILTGYLNVPKILELALNDGIDPLTDKTIGPRTGNNREYSDFYALYHAFEQQLHYIVNLKIGVNNYIERMYAANAPAPFLSAVIEDCIAKGKDYYNAGPRYNTNYIPCCGIGTITDSLSAIKKHVFEKKEIIARTGQGAF